MFNTAMERTRTGGAVAPWKVTWTAAKPVPVAWIVAVHDDDPGHEGCETKTKAPGASPPWDPTICHA